MVTIKKGQGCGNRPLVSGTVGKREDGTKKHPVDVESILCSVFCGENKDEILKMKRTETILILFVDIILNGIVFSY